MLTHCRHAFVLATKSGRRGVYAPPGEHEPQPGPDPGQQPDRTVMHSVPQGSAYESMFTAARETGPAVGEPDQLPNGRLGGVRRAREAAVSGYVDDAIASRND